MNREIGAAIYTLNERSKQIKLGILWKVFIVMWITEKHFNYFCKLLSICNYQSPPNTKRLMPFPLLYIYYLKTMYPVWVVCQILDLAPPVPNFVYQYIFGNVKTITIINQAFEPFWNSNHLLPVMVYELSYVFCLEVGPDVIGKEMKFSFRLDHC